MVQQDCSVKLLYSICFGSFTPGQKTNMVQNRQTSMPLTLGILVTVVTMATANIFTSSLKVERLASEEQTVLDEFKRYIDQQYNKLQTLSTFYQDRMKELAQRGVSHQLENLEHPNAVYKTIKRFASDFATALGEDFEKFRCSMPPTTVAFEADSGDVRGARLSLLRLQSVYRLEPADMAKGDYLGYHGPPLTPDDTFSVAQTAFSEGMLNQSLQWLNLTLTLLSRKDPETYLGWTSDHVQALMARVYLYRGDVSIAQGIYEAVRHIDPLPGDVVELASELQTLPRVTEKCQLEHFDNFSRLCSLENKLHVGNPYHPSLICRYKEALLPYYRFQEEILSVAPYASVFYNIITDNETETLKGHVKNKLERGKVGEVSGPSISDFRTSDLAWIWDDESAKANVISQRIKNLLGLEVDQRLPDGPASAEAFQVVNYGLGGHYFVHMDPFIFKNKTDLPLLRNSGERIATFLMYLSDVTRGGSTVFPMAEVAVPPIKNMALFWYNFDPAHQVDNLTHHGGCPVLIGQKWIVNKWIWTVGNTFRRRCGLSPDATQLDIEPDMKTFYGQRRAG